MPFLLLIFLAFVCMPEQSDWPAASPWIAATPLLSALETLLILALPVLYAARLARHVAGPLERDPSLRERVLRAYQRGRGRHQILLYTCYVVALCVLGWGHTAFTLWTWQGHTLPGPELVLIAPFLGALVLSWCCFYDADRASHRAAHRLLGLELADPDGEPPAEARTGFGGRAAYVGFQARQKLALALLPLLLVLGQKEMQPPRARALAGLAVGRQPGRPPQRAGDLRSPCPGSFAWSSACGRCRRGRCATACRLLHAVSTSAAATSSSGTRNGGMANAMVVGVLPWLRYVVFTDRLLEEFTADEVEAVFGHEVGHVKHRHMLYYLAFLIAEHSLVPGPGLPRVRRRRSRRTTAAALGVLAGQQRTCDYLPPVACMLVYILWSSASCRGAASGRRTCTAAGRCRAPGPTASATTTAPELPAGGRGLCPTGIRTFIQRPGTRWPWSTASAGIGRASCNHGSTRPSPAASNSCSACSPTQPSSRAFSGAWPW